MASFTDAISTFNPYVSQIPVDAIVKVGTYKQAQYDQGVQKIQNYIDNIAGMDVLNDADKEYLHSKLNQLGSNLKTVAAGDFSNQQLVNSVGGMASQIIRDENVQNAMFSTANAKKQQERIDADIKKGKLNKAGEYIYNKDLQKYMSNKEVGQRFTGQYRPRTSEYDKKILEVIKTLEPNLTQEDIAYFTDPATGKVNISEVMQRYSNETLSEGKIRTAINAVLNADDLEAMREDGIYNYRQYGEKDIANLIKETTNKNFEIGAARLKQLKTQLPGLTDPDKILETKKEIAQYERQIGDPYMDIPSALRIQEQQSLAELADPDKLDQVKSQIFLRNTIDEYSNAFAYAKIKNEIMTSPLQSQENWRAEQEFKRVVEANQEYDRAEARRIAKGKELRDINQEIRDQKKFEKEINPSGTPVFTGVGNETEQDRRAVINWVNDTQKYRTANVGLRTQLKDKMGGMFSDLTDAELDAKIAAYKKDPVGNKPDDNSIKQIMDNYLSNERYIAKKDIIFNEATKKATDYVTGGKGIYGMLRDDLAKLPRLTIPGTKGRQTFTAEEVLNYQNKFEKTTSVPLATPGGGGQPAITISASGRMNARELELYNYLKNQGRYVSAGGGRVKDQVANAYLSTTLNSSRSKYNDISSKIAERKVEILAPYTGPFKTEGAGIEFSGSDGNTKQNFIDKLRNVVSNDLRQEGGGKDYDAENLLEVLSKKGADAILGFGVERAGDAYKIQVQDDSGNFQNIPVSRDWIKTNLGEQWLNKAASTQMQMFSFGGVTNPTKNVELSQYAPNDFGNYDSGQKSVTLNIYANLRDQGNGNGTVTFNLKNKRGETIPIVWPGRQGITSTDNFPRWLEVQSDATLLPLLRNLYPGVDKFLAR